LTNTAFYRNVEKMKMLIRTILLVLLLLSCSDFSLNADDTTADSTSPPWIPENIIEITTDFGLGIYTGDFYDHLVREGAYILTPVLDLYVSFFIIRWMGIQVLISSGTVIHPASTPIEGTLLYMGVELFGRYDWKRIYIKGFAGAGFQHTTMLLSVYASAFFEGGLGVGVHITKWLSMFLSTKYRAAFLRSLLIFQEYPTLDEFADNDRLQSITISLGLAVKIKNPWYRD
jgi:hypothetical protein